jgi:CHAT domain-containing protein
MSRGLVVLALLLHFAVPSHAFPEDAHDVAGAVTTFYAAYAAGDVARARAQWASESAIEFARYFEHSSEVRCMTLRRFATGPVQLDGDSATLRAEADLVSWSRHPADRGREETVVAIAKLARKDGRWQIVAWTPIETEMAGAIVAGAPWQEVVPAALEKGARIRLLVRELTRQAVYRFNRNSPREGDPLVAAAIEIAAQYADSDAMSEAIGARSILQNSNGKQSERWAMEALTLAQKRGNPDVVARALDRLARAHNLSWIKRREPYDQVLAMADSIESLVTVANASVELADIFNWKGDYRSSLLQSLQTLKYGNLSGERTTILTADLGLGATYLFQGDQEMAVPYLEQAVELARETKVLIALPHCLRMLAHALWSTNRRAEARARLDEALALAGADGAVLLLSRARFSLDAHDPECAEVDLLAAIAAGKTVAQSDLAQVWALLSSVRLAQGRFEEALECARIGAQLAEDAYSSVGVDEALALRKLGRLQEAAAELRRAVAIADDRRAFAVSEARQLQMFTQNRVHVYAELADVLVDLGRQEEAIEVVTRMHGRTLRDLRAAEGAAFDPADRLHRERLERRIEELNGSILRAGSDARPSLHDELAKARLDLDDFLARRAVSQRASSVRAATAAPPVQLGDVTVIEYLIARERLLAFVRLPDAHGAVRLHVVPIAITPERLRVSVDAFVDSIERRDLRVARSARSLYDLLIAPVERFIGGARAVCIIPDGELWRLPFHALRSANGRYLSEDAPIFYAPSVDFLSKPAERLRGGERIDLLAFANATVGGDAAATIRALYRNARLGSLPDAETEVKGLARIYGPSKSRLYLGSEARESVFKRDGASSRVVHIATHGILDDQSPMYSALILAAGKDDGEDGLLEVREIASMRLDADIAVLSACETARGHVAAGDGVVGIAWAFLVAGCPTTVVSQWKADSAATAELMVAFHRHLRAGAAPAEALRRAQRELRRNPRYRDPLYWAPFIVLGASR